MMNTLAVLLVLSLIGVVKLNSDCPPYLISVNDVQLALKAALFSYGPQAIVGNDIPGTDFQVVAIGEESMPTTQSQSHPSSVKVIVAIKDDTIIISYRGTDTNDQLLQQVLNILQNPHGEKVTIDGETATIIQYFWDGFELLYNHVEPYLDQHNKRYIITGHSLGGAMASILSIMAIERKHTAVWQSPESSLITFGQPRTGDGIYAQKHDELISSYRKLRLNNRNDLISIFQIPLIPKAVHHSREIWMKKETWSFFNFRPKLYWRVCDKGDAELCSKKKVIIPSINDHKEYEEFIHSHPPVVFYDEYKKKHVTFEDALYASCS